MAIASLTVDINARLAGIEGDLGKVSRLAEQSAAKMSRAFDGVGESLRNVFAGVALGSAVSGFGRLVTQALDAQDALSDLSKSTAISIDLLAGLKGAAITSTQTAVKEGKNTFNTAGDLTLSDLHNEATYDAQGGSVTLGTQLNEGKYTPQGTSAGYGEAGEEGSRAEADLYRVRQHVRARCRTPCRRRDRIGQADGAAGGDRARVGWHRG